MTVTKMSFDSKDPGEIVPLSFDFRGLTSEPSNPVIAVTRFSGNPDASDLTSMLVGAPQVIGTQIRQKVTGGVLGTNYRFRCQVDTPEGLRWVLAGVMAVELS